MRVKGEATVRDYGTARVVRSDGAVVELKIRAVGSEVELLLAHPAWHVEPPTEVKRDKRGRVERDKDGQPVMVVNRESAKYKAEQHKRSVLYTAAYTYLGLVREDEGGDVSWDTDPAMMEEEPVKFFELIDREMQDAGWSQGARASLFKQIHELSVPTKEEVESAEQSFQDG